MNKKKRAPQHLHGSNLSFIDMLFNLVLGFCLLFFIAFLMMNPISQEKKIESKAEILIVMTWPDKSPHDIDLWTLSPELKPIGFPRRESEYIHLERDDLGLTNDTVTTPDGKQQFIYLNQEVITIRSKQPGRYVVNIQWYSAKPILAEDGSQQPLDLSPVPVKVQLIQVNPTYRVVSVRDLVLDQVKEEKTAFAFDITDGQITDIRYDDVPFVMEAIVNRATHP